MTARTAVRPGFARVIRAAGAGTLLLLFSLPVEAESCQTERYGGTVCGEGSDALRVIADTTSPSKRFAFAWRTPQGLPAGDEVPETDSVENFLIRLSDGVILAKLGGTYWETGEMRASRYDVRAIWSSDSRAVIEVSNERWDTYALAYYTLGTDDTAVALDLRGLIESAVRARLPADKRRSYVFRVDDDRKVTLDPRGRGQLPAMLQVPKQPTSLNFDVRFAVTQAGGKPAARITAVQQVRGN